MKALYNNGEVRTLAPEEESHVIRHTAAHIMAQAILRLHPQAKFAYGPATERGFYYDVDLGEEKLSDEDLAAIEAEMAKITKENLPIKTYELPRDEAIRLMESRGEVYKVEHIGDLDADARITFYQQGDYIDMCVGPHLTYTKALKAFKITGQSGAYWKNNSENKMLTRINGVAFHNAEELYLAFGEAIYPSAVFEQARDLLVESAKAVTDADLVRFAILAETIEGFDVVDLLHRIECPVLVLGSKDDRALGGEASEQVAEKLKDKPGCELVMYEGYGHAAYDLAPDYRERLKTFFLKDTER